jgi:hypothetical protein
VGPRHGCPSSDGPVSCLRRGRRDALDPRLAHADCQLIFCACVVACATPWSMFAKPRSACAKCRVAFAKSRPACAGHGSVCVVCRYACEEPRVAFFACWLAAHRVGPLFAKATRQNQNPGQHAARAYRRIAHVGSHSQRVGSLFAKIARSFAKLGSHKGFVGRHRRMSIDILRTWTGILEKSTHDRQLSCQYPATPDRTCNDPAASFRNSGVGEPIRLQRSCSPCPEMECLTRATTTTSNLSVDRRFDSTG